MTTAGIILSRSEINKKLLNSLPKNWDMNISVIKKTKDLNRLSLAETMAIIKAFDMDDRQREINHVNSYSAASLGSSTNSAFSSLPTHHTPSPTSSSLSQASSVPGPSEKSTSPAPVPANAKGAEENLALMAGFMNWYNAFISGELVPPVSIGELEQIHPDDVEEMDIS